MPKTSIPSSDVNPDVPMVVCSPLAKALERFASERDWHQFHSPKNLAMALSGEVGELTEIFQWMSEQESFQAAANERTSERLRHELADVLLYLVRLADVLGVDLDAAAKEKLALNAQKYPVEKARGNAKKYDEL